MLEARSIHGVGENSWQTGEWQLCDESFLPLSVPARLKPLKRPKAERGEPAAATGCRSNRPPIPARRRSREDGLVGFQFQVVDLA